MSSDLVDDSASKQQAKESFAEQFYRYFGRESASLEESISSLRVTPSHERKDAMDHCAAGIARLAKEVKEAASGSSLGVGATRPGGGGKIPARDQKTYNDAVASLMDKLKKVRLEMASSKSASSFGGGLRFGMSSRGMRGALSENGDKNQIVQKKEQVEIKPEDDEEITRINKSLQESNSSSTSIQTVDFSKSKSVTLTTHSNMRARAAALPTLDRYSVLLTDISSAYVDISSTSTTRPTNLVLKVISHSILLLGSVNGPAHITGLKNTVIILACKQFRMHECQKVQVYLHCGSRPVVENVKEVEFAPLPSDLQSDMETKGGPFGLNKWDKVQDFKWIKAEPSPNWKILPDEHKLEDDRWNELKAGVDITAAEILNVVAL